MNGEEDKGLRFRVPGFVACLGLRVAWADLWALGVEGSGFRAFFGDWVDSGNHKPVNPNLTPVRK